MTHNQKIVGSSPTRSTKDITYRLSCKIKNCKIIFMKELGEGVIGSREIIFHDVDNEEDTMLIKQLLEHEEAFIKDLVEVKIERV